jgi:glycosyltransferase involved in cell wall biosynthesis
MPVPGTPLIGDVGLLALPYHRFGSRWVTPHHVLTRLANYFHVIWLEPAHHWREAASVRDRKAAIAKLLPSLPPGFRVYVPEVWLPDTHRPPSVRRWLSEARISRGWRLLREQGCQTLVLHLWHHRFASALAVGQHRLSLYHIDDEYSFEFEPPPMDACERRVMQEVDHVFAISPGLMERKAGINPNMTLVPEGVDYGLYSTPAPEPPDIASIPHPRIGYTGALKVQLDWTLLHDLALRHREWSFVFIGPRARNGEVIDEISRLENVHFLGAKSVRDLAAYPQHFDVCIMPYLLNGYTNNIYPLKLHEYLASGRPVVGSPVRALREFAPVIALASTPEEWSDALARALVPPEASPDAAATRQDVARRYDWSELVHHLAATVCERLGPAYTARLRKLRVGTPSFVPSCS